MSINITTEPIEVVLNGVTFFLQGDPTASPAWDALLETRIFYTGDAGAKSRTQVLEALAALAQTDTDRDTILGLTDGTPTLERAIHGYVSAVTGFPTQPPSSSTKGSKRTGRN